MSDMHELRAIEADLRREETAFDELSRRLADAQDSYERDKILERMDARRQHISRLRQELRTCTERLKP